VPRQINQPWKDLRLAGTYLPHEEVMMNLRAGELMGRQILAKRQGSPRNLSMMHALKPQYRGWVKSDSADARRWLDELPEGDYRKQMTLKDRRGARMGPANGMRGEGHRSRIGAGRHHRPHARQQTEPGGEVAGQPPGKPRLGDPARGNRGKGGGYGSRGAGARTG
jgi:hypothetical protein